MHTILHAVRIKKNNKIHLLHSCSYIFFNFSYFIILFYYIKRFYILLRIYKKYTHYILPSKSGMIPSPLKTFNDNVSFTVVYLRCVSRTRRR